MILFTPFCANQHFFLRSQSSYGYFGSWDRQTLSSWTPQTVRGGPIFQCTSLIILFLSLIFLISLICCHLKRGYIWLFNPSQTTLSTCLMYSAVNPILVLSYFCRSKVMWRYFLVSHTDGAYATKTKTNRLWKQLKKLIRTCWTGLLSISSDTIKKNEVFPLFVWVHNVLLLHMLNKLKASSEKYRAFHTWVDIAIL